MDVEVKGAIDELGRAVSALRETQATELKEIREKGFVTAETLEKYEKINAAIDKAEDAKTKAEKASERIDGIETAMSRTGGGAALSLDPKVKAHAEGLDSYLRKGETAAIDGMKNDFVPCFAQKGLETKAVRTIVLSDGGYAATPDRQSEVVAFLTESVGMRQAARVVGTSKGVYELLRRTNRAASGGWVSEQGSRAATASPAWGIARIEPGELYSNVPVTQTALDDMDVDIESEIMQDAQMDFAVSENTGFILGNGIGKPRGILTYDAGTSDQQIEQVVSGSASDLTAAGLITLQETLFEELQANAKWMFSRATRGRIRRFTEAVNGQFLWQPGLAAGVPPTLLGKPYVIGSDMPAIGTNSLSVAYGDFMRGYRIVDRIGVRVLRDPFTSKPNVLFYITKRTGGDVVQFQSIKLQKCST